MCRQNYGFAGKAFVDLLHDPSVVGVAREMYSKFSADLAKGDTTEKQVMAAALILTADHLATDHIFMDGEPLSIGPIQDFLKTRASVDVNERAYEYICEYVIQNKMKFSGESEVGEVCGKIQDAEIAIIRRAFIQICDEAGYNSQSLLSWLKQKGLLNFNGKGFTRSARINGEPCNCVVIKRKIDDYFCAEIPDCDAAV